MGCRFYRIGRVSRGSVKFGDTTGRYFGGFIFVFRREVGGFWRLSFFEI